MLLKQQRQLIDTGLVTQEQISEAMQSNEAKQGGLLFGLIALDGIDSNSILQALAKIYKVPYLDLNHVEIDERLIEKCPEELCREFNFVPVAMSGGELVIATADPMDYAAMDTLQFKLGQRVRSVFTNPELIQTKIRDLFSDGDAAFDDAMASMDETGDFEAGVEDENESADIDSFKKERKARQSSSW